MNPIVADFVERAGWSAGQVFFATLLAGGTTVTVANLPWKYASALAVSAAVSSAVLTAIQYLTHTTRLSFWPDMLVRLAKTFLSSLAASFAVANPLNIVEFDWTTALNLAAVTVIVAFGKGLLARGSVAGEGADRVTAHTPDVSNPSTLPTNTYQAAIDR